MKIIISILTVGLLLVTLGCSLDTINSSEQPDFSKVDQMDDLIIKNRPPVIQCIECSQTPIRPNSQVKINVRAYDPDGDELTYEYAAQGDIMIKSSLAYWSVPDVAGAYTIVVKVSDGEYTVIKKVILEVTDMILNQPDKY